MGIKDFFKKEFGDMKKSAQAQHELDKANFAAAKAEAKADFESHRSSVTFQKAKADAKASWEDAKMSPAQRQAKMQEERESQIAAAKERKQAAEARIDELKK